MPVRVQHGYSDGMHHIQRHILKQLIENNTRRYAELRPKAIEPNQFVYHLKQLIKTGLVAKCTDGYELTAEGRTYADKLDHSSYEMPWQTQPRNVLFLALYSAELGWLLVRRDKQPTIGKVGFLSANMELGEAILDTARHFVAAEHNIEANFRYVCSGTVTLLRGEALESYVGFHLLCADIEALSAMPAREDSLRWYQLNELSDALVLPSTLPLLDVVAKPGASSTFIELTFSV